MSQPNSGSTFLTFECGAQSGTAISNTANIMLEDTISISKSCLMNDYFLADNIVYSISITNNSALPVSKVKIKENLGTYKINNASASITPLIYANSFEYYVNGVRQIIADPKIYSDKIIFDVISIPPTSTALLFYAVKVTDKAPLKSKSFIENKTLITSSLSEKSFEASHTINVRDNAEIRIIKRIKTSKIISGGGIGYELLIYNYGNTDATNVAIKDTLIPEISAVKITINSRQLDLGDFSYCAGTLQIPSYGTKTAISVPAATFTHDEASGRVNVTPGYTEIAIEGHT